MIKSWTTEQLDFGDGWVRAKYTFSCPICESNDVRTNIGKIPLTEIKEFKCSSCGSTFKRKKDNSNVWQFIEEKDKWKKNIK